MRSVIIGLIVVTAVLAVAPEISAQTGGAKGTPDLSGVWNRRATTDRSGVFADDPGGVPFLGFSKEAPPLTAQAMEKYKANRQGITDAKARGRNNLDPLNSCFPPGPTRVFTEPRPFEIRQVPEVVYILTEVDHWVRRIYTDEKNRIEGYPVTWMGYSFGKVDGDAFVVETTDINDATWIDSLGTPHSEDLKVRERFRRVNRNTLEIEFTFDDPKTFTKPWTGKKVFQLQPPGTALKDEAVCEEYRKMGLRKDGYEFIKP